MKGSVIMWADAVFEGGGVKGIGLVGALSVAEKKGYRWKNVAGTSAGSIIATLIAAGYSAEEMYELLMKKDFSEFLTPSWIDRFEYVGYALKLWLKKGIYSGDALEKWIDELLLERGIRTPKDLPSDMQLHIIVSDITRGEIVVLPRDLKDYGYVPDDFPIARMVRMSCSIPFLFEPVKLVHQSTNTPCYIVDGGVLSNFPVWLFDADEPRWPTFGFRLISKDDKKFNQIEGPLSMFRSILFTMMDAHDNRYIQENEALRTIMVPSLDVKLTDFDLDKSKKEALYQSGVRAAEQFFKTFSFEKYMVNRKRKKEIS